MDRRPVSVLLVAVTVGAFFVARRVRDHRAGRQVPGGLIVAHPGRYDVQARLLFGPLFEAIGSDIAAAVSPGARLLEVGCGPGHLSIRLAREHGLDVTGVDLDPAMIQLADENATSESGADERTPAFIIGDVAALPFEDGAFDIVVSTFSMHHWTDPVTGLREIRRVLRPGGRALIWDLKPGFRLFHVHAPDPAELIRVGPLRLVNVRPWRWPWRFSFSQRLELVRD